MRVDPNKPLSDLDSELFRQLEDSLQKDDAWKRVAECVKKLGGLSGRRLLDLSRCENPATRLLEDFKTKLYEIRHLKALFKHCELYDALSVIADPEPLVIIKQPSSFLQGNEIVKAKIGDALCLKFEVFGVPPPKYSWLLNGLPIPNKYSSVLSYDSYDPSLEGLYTCVATQFIQERQTGTIYSEVILVETLPEPPFITQRPDSHISLCEGSPILLKIKATGYPAPTFKWTHDDDVIEHETANSLYREKSTKADGGIYKCHVTNRAGTEIVEINVVIYRENATALYSGAVTDKVALLIANDDYANYERLSTPKNDVAEMARIFKRLGFKTLCFLNLNLHEMKVVVNIFGELVARGAYAVFYFAGHGFSAGDAFLLPVDCPDYDTYTQKDCIRESMILKAVMEKEPALCIVFLDMCLKQFKRKMGKSALLRYKSNRNLIRAYSTTNHKSSYEKSDECTSIYVSALSKYLGEKMPILAILNRVNAEIAQLCPKQMPTVSFITAEDFLLDQEINALQTENTTYKYFNFESDFSDDMFSLKKFKDVYNNVLEVHIRNSEVLSYTSNADSVAHEKTENDNHFLIITDVQRLESDLKISVTTQPSVTREITLPTSKLSIFFINI